MFNNEYWQGRMDEQLLARSKESYKPEPLVLPSFDPPPVRYVEVVKESSAPPPYIPSAFSSLSVADKRRVDSENGYPDAYRIRAFRHLLEKHRKSMVALALESMYPRFDAKEAKDERGIEQYARTVSAVKEIGIKECNDFMDEDNRNFYESSNNLQSARLKHLAKIISCGKAVAEANLTTTAKQRILPAI